MTSDLGWRADGIERALAAGGVPLEKYRRPGFEQGIGVRRADGAGAGAGFPIDRDPYYDQPEPGEPEDGKRRRKRR